MSKTTISGNAIKGIFDTMGILGPIGKKILSKYKISKLDINKQYPYEIRKDIFEEAFQSFGEEALYAFGVKNTKAWKEFNDSIDQFYANNKKIILSRNKKEYTKGVTNFSKQVILLMGDLVKKATISNYKNYGSIIEEIKGTKIFFNVTITLGINHEAFVRGIVTALIYKRVADIWDLKVKYIREKSKEGKNWVRWHYEAELIRLNKKRSLREINNVFTNNVNERLFLNVINDSEKQKELSEMQREKIENISAQLSKYIPPQIHDALFAGKYDTEIKTQRRKLTVFFSDIRNFTSTSENLQPEDLTKYLNEYFSEMTKIALNHGATIDKYIGDAMMVFFGDPETKGEREDARACVEMALKMQERMGELREKWLNEGFADPFEVRIGINTGYCNVGNFGSDQRLTYTIIGGEVNVAARLESAAEANGILMSYETYAHVQDMVEVEQKEAIKMKGINREIKIYAVEGRKEVVKTKAKVTKAKKPTKKELTEIEKLKKESLMLKQESMQLKKELAFIKLELKN